MSLVIEALSRIDHAPQTFSSPRRTKEAIRSTERQERGVLLGRDVRNGEITGAEVIVYRRQRLIAMQEDWSSIKDEFPGQFEEPDYRKQG